MVKPEIHVVMGWVGTLPFTIPDNVQTVFWQCLGAILSYYAVKFIQKRDKLKAK